MKRLQYLLLISCIVFSMHCANAYAQSRPLPVIPTAKLLPAPRGPSHTASIDMQRILAESRLFQKKLAAARAANDERQVEVTKLRDEVNSVGSQLLQFTPGSTNYTETIHRLHAMQGGLVTAEKTAQYECDRAEVAVYNEFYALVEETVEEFAIRHNISLVLNRPKPARTGDEVTEAKELFSQRIAYETKIDITDDILRELGG
jgi:hypothetical protein